MELDLLLLPLDELVAFFHCQYGRLEMWDRAWATALKRSDFRERVIDGEYSWYRSMDAVPVVRGARKAGYRMRITSGQIHGEPYWSVLSMEKL